jgi:hypothetical protein
MQAVGCGQDWQQLELGALVVQHRHLHGQDTEATFSLTAAAQGFHLHNTHALLLSEEHTVNCISQLSVAAVSTMHQCRSWLFQAHRPPLMRERIMTIAPLDCLVVQTAGGLRCIVWQ